MDVTDLYTMIPQEGGVTAIKRLMETSNLKQIDGVKKEIILALTRFVMTNNYFYFDGSYYKQIRGGAMGSPLTLTIANTYMYFVERPVFKWAHRTCSLYFRYIDDLFIMLDSNIELSESIGITAEYLDVKLENRGGVLITEVFHKPSHEPYSLPFTSTHAQHIKKNIPDAIIDLYNETRSIANRTIVLHAMRDDGGKGGFPDSNSTGNAGARIACGTISITMEESNGKRYASKVPKMVTNFFQKLFP
ncbi:unnamed protein product [Adineta steineri]|nr:unnamed protein product [Adineta steineri]CAF0991776.1 unnamed protein product [Adineta steineri]CAF1086355.1 unnamed protein product [Adineta steineri]CAF1143757.1 unnamed protein product [Adineta steineri]CAF1241117.1 unnamed protein product [Adineta steineri]